MRLPGSRRVMPAIVILFAAASSGLLVAIAPTAHAHIRADYCPASAPCTPPPPSPNPTPTPVNAFISLDVTAGPPDTAITVNGSAFLANESTSLYWDVPTKVAGASNADANGNFTTKVKPFAGDAPGVHKLCASVQPNPCANFNLQAATASPSASPSASASPDTSPSPTAGPSESPSPTPAAATISGLDVMMKPPFVILPIIAAAGFAIALGYWILSLVMRPRQQTLKSVTVAHVASRPDYSAGFGTPPPTPAPAVAEPSAWTEPVATHPPPAPPAVEPVETSPLDAAPLDAAPPETAPPETAPPPDVEDVMPASPDEPPDLPEPSDY
jgi:hypothetical protein